jgi:hypothetical protein
MNEKTIKLEVKNLRKKKSFIIEILDKEKLVNLHQRIIEQSNLSWEHSFSVYLIVSWFFPNQKDYLHTHFHHPKTCHS